MADVASVEQLDGITLIINDHRNVEDVFTRYEQATSPDDRLRLVAKMIEELSTHAAIEERELYPLLVDRLDDGEELESHAVEEHQEARDVLAELERMPLSDGAFDDTVRELIEDVRHHVREEESDMLPRLRGALDHDERLRLGERLRRAKANAPVSPSQGNGGARGGEASKEELYEEAKKLGIEGRSRMSKDELAREVEARR